MCHGDEARPPVPPGAAAEVGEEGELRLTAEDGNTFLAYQALPVEPAKAGVVLLPDVRGLHEFYRDLARRFAQAGIAALAIDYYGRVAVGDHRGPGFDGFAHVLKLRPEEVAADVRVAVDRLVEQGVGSVFTVGFCFGGAQSWLQSAVDGRVAGAVGFYGRPEECRARLLDMRAPLLVLAAGADVLTPAEEANRFDRELTEAGVPHEFVLYANAPHSFFDAAFADHAEACADAWRRVLRFIEGAS